MNLSDKIRNTILKADLLEKGQKIVVGVSGGPDSLALLLLLNNIKKELDLSLHVAHLDHGLRKDSAKDARFVKDICSDLKLPCTIKKVNTLDFSKNRSVEETARELRLDFFFDVARSTGAKIIALGHNRDDQAETVLMRLLRGSGLQGLSAIIPKKTMKGFTLIRPLINIPRPEIERFLTKRAIRARIDSTNLEETYLRNRIRLKLLPELEKQYNKNIRQLLANTAENVGSDYDLIESLAKKLFPKFKGKFELKKFKRLHPSLQRMLIRMNISFKKGNTRRIGYQHMKEIEDLIKNRPEGSIVDLPENISAVKKKGKLLFYSK